MLIIDCDNVDDHCYKHDQLCFKIVLIDPVCVTHLSESISSMRTRLFEMCLHCHQNHMLPC